MVEPRIQYAKTEDGVSIAFWTMGEGMPLVHMAFPGFSHIQAEWQIPEIRHFYEGLAAERMLIRFDAAGMGLSQRDVSVLSMQAQGLSLEAVVDHLQLQRFALFAPTHMGATAITYAAAHPDRLSHLLLWCSYARSSDWTGNARVQATRSLAEKDWATYSETVAQGSLAWSGGELARRLAALLRESVTQKAMIANFASPRPVDVSSILPQVSAPTLVLSRRQLGLPEAVSRELTSEIPDARLVLLEGEALAPFAGDSEAVLGAIDEFLGGSGQMPTASKTPTGGFATILFTDMEGSTTLADRLGDAGAQEVRRAHNEIVRGALGANGGNEIKHTGDGIMASFATASSALDCAISIQRGVAAHRDANPDSPLGVYVGLNAGEPIAEEDPDGRVDLFGTSINLAARICDHAQAGQILAADVVRQLTAGKQFLFADLGETELRGFEDPVKLWELRWEGQS